jgi:hypothetical protein
MRRAAPAVLLLALALAPPAPAARAGEAPPAPSLAQRIDAAIAKGVAYLVRTQRADGSWGGPAPNLHVDIYAPVPGSNRAFTVGASALALSALIEVGGDTPAVREAIRKGTDYLLRRHVVRRSSADSLYNVWPLAYSLETFARLLARHPTPEQRKRLMKASADCVAWLGRMQFVEGGWGYFNFQEQTARPGPGSTSFTTASVVVGLAMAQAQGVAVPRKLVAGGDALIRRCAIPDGSFAYSYRTRLWALRGRVGNINYTQGSLARTPACLLAWELSGYPVDPARFSKALDELETYGGFLRLARKYPIPHETWYQNSGYFCFYGYYYASRLIALVPADRRATYRRQIAGHLLGLQEEDGSWWDYQLYQVHKPYGTGYVLMALGRCR